MGCLWVAMSVGGEWQRMGCLWVAVSMGGEWQRMGCLWVADIPHSPLPTPHSPFPIPHSLFPNRVFTEISPRWVESPYFY